ncbi:MAG: hypothetical protein PF447_07155, partial [Spirochaetaceae bacterium]|nr:hypothetical protein [Spirochaetaceae bacterium]
AEISGPLAPGDLSKDLEFSPYQGFTFGLDLTLQSSKKYILGFSLMNLLPLLRSSFDENEFTSLVFKISYKP